ncbi:MAG: phosphatidylserine decarboxylase family protein [Vicingaceae bacterium]
MTIHKEGFASIAVSFLLLALINLLFLYLLVDFPIIRYGLLLVSSIFFVLIVRFFRDPNIEIERSEKGILSPADGTVVAIEEMKDGEYFQENRMQVSVFMSPLNVHVNRYPISGEVKYFKHHNGHFHVAWNPKSSVENEHTSTVVKHSSGIEILFKQIAGAVARRIVSYASVDQEVLQGQQCGFIKFGSRVDVLLPLNSQIHVEIGQKVLGGRTILATLK